MKKINKTVVSIEKKSDPIISAAVGAVVGGVTGGPIGVYEESKKDIQLRKIFIWSPTTTFLLR